MRCGDARRFEVGDVTRRAVVMRRCAREGAARFPVRHWDAHSVRFCCMGVSVGELGKGDGRGVCGPEGEERRGHRYELVHVVVLANWC